MSLEERAYDDLQQMGVDVIHCRLKSNRAISFGERYVGVDLRGLDAQHRCAVLCHEVGHFESNAFYYINSPFEIKGKAEAKARRALVERYIKYTELMECLRSGITEHWELAEYFEVTEKEIITAIHLYRDTLGYDFEGNEDF